MHPLGNQPCVKHSTQSSPFMCPTTQRGQDHHYPHFTDWGKLSLSNLVILLLRCTGRISDSIFLTVGRGQGRVWTLSSPNLPTSRPHSEGAAQGSRLIRKTVMYSNPALTWKSLLGSFLGTRGQGRATPSWDTFPVAPIQTLPSWPPNILFQFKNKNKKQLVTCENRLSSTE